MRALDPVFGRAGLLVSGVLLLGGTAAAGPIAFAQLEITGLTLSASGASITVGSIGTSPELGGPSGSFARIYPDQEVVFIEPIDAPLACIGSGCASIGENDFSQQSAGEFVRGDSVILGTDLLAGTAGARMVSEHRDIAAPFGSDNHGFFDILTTITLDADAPLTISFSADVFVAVSNDSDNGAVADTHLNIRIPNAPGPAGIGFWWAPDVIFGGTTIAEPFDLNPFNLLAPPGGTYDPTGDGLGGDSGFFSATTNTLTAGVSYQLWIRASARTGGVTSVGEPSALVSLAMGAGLLRLIRRVQSRRGDLRASVDSSVA